MVFTVLWFDFRHQQRDRGSQRTFHQTSHPQALAVAVIQTPVAGRMKVQCQHRREAMITPGLAGNGSKLTCCDVTLSRRPAVVIVQTSDRCRWKIPALDSADACDARIGGRSKLACLIRQPMDPAQFKFAAIGLQPTEFVIADSGVFALLTAHYDQGF